MRRAILAKIGLVLMAVALIGCAPSPSLGEPVRQDVRFEEVHIPMKNDTRVTCLVYASGYAGGLSCDWAGAK